MARPKRGAASGSGNNNENVGGMTMEEIRQMVADEVGNSVRDAIPGIITAVQTEIAALRAEIMNQMEERITAIPAANPRAREFQFRDFAQCAPPTFHGSVDPLVCMRWITDMEGAFLTSGCPDNMKVRFTMNQLRDSGKNWGTSALTVAERTTLEWEEFVRRFKAEYVPEVEIERISQEFLSFVQTSETIPELNRKFNEMVIFCPEYAATEEMKMSRYKGMLKAEIREFVGVNRYPNVASMMDAARRRELEAEFITMKRKKEEAVPSVIKKVKVEDVRGKSREGSSTSREKESKDVVVCYKCGDKGHYSRDCRTPLKICFNCKQTGHFKANCPNPSVAGGAVAPQPLAAIPAPLRIADGRAGQDRPAANRARVHQMLGEEA